jgi:fucose permease
MLGVSRQGTLGMLVGNEPIAVASIRVTGLGFGNIFPLIFSILIDRMPERSVELSGLLCMAIVGGAVVPLAMGALDDAFGVAWAMAVPFGASLYILFARPALAARGQALRPRSPCPTPRIHVWC